MLKGQENEMPKIRDLGTPKNVPIDSIKPYENNPRDNDSAVGGVAKSLQQYGWQQPIVVDKDNKIIVGHTRYKAAQKLELKNVPVIVAKDLTPDQVKGYRLADNKTGENAIWDNKKLLKELEKLNNEIYTGFKESGIFEDVLDESDNSPVVENDKGITYSMKFSTQNKEAFEKIKQYATEVLAVES